LRIVVLELSGVWVVRLGHCLVLRLPAHDCLLFLVPLHFVSTAERDQSLRTPPNIRKGPQ